MLSLRPLQIESDYIFLLLFRIAPKYSLHQRIAIHDKSIRSLSFHFLLVYPSGFRLGMGDCFLDRIIRFIRGGHLFLFISWKERIYWSGCRKEKSRVLRLWIESFRRLLGYFLQLCSKKSMIFLNKSRDKERHLNKERNTYDIIWSEGIETSVKAVKNSLIMCFFKW